MQGHNCSTSMPHNSHTGLSSHYPVSLQKHATHTHTMQVLVSAEPVPINMPPQHSCARVSPTCPQQHATKISLVSAQKVPSNMRPQHAGDPVSIVLCRSIASPCRAMCLHTAATCSYTITTCLLPAAPACTCLPLHITHMSADSSCSSC